MAKNIYTHSIELKELHIKNAPKEQFSKLLSDIPYRGYEVECLSDGRKIVITKPGGKSVFGNPKKEDFLVFIYNPEDSSLWQISHGQIYEDVENKAKEDKTKTESLFSLFERVLNGEDPKDLSNEIESLHFSSGESPETLLKVYKWIWGQEDVNYPNGEGRMMSWKALKSLKESL